MCYKFQSEYEGLRIRRADDVVQVQGEEKANVSAQAVRQRENSSAFLFYLGSQWVGRYPFTLGKISALPNSSIQMLVSPGCTFTDTLRNNV